jgi:hypothetical protein
MARGAGAKRLSGAVYGCSCNRRLGAHPTDMVRALSHVLFFNPGPVRRVQIPNRYTAKAKLCFCKNNKRRIIPVSGPRGCRALPQYFPRFSSTLFAAAGEMMLFIGT